MQNNLICFYINFISWSSSFNQKDCTKDLNFKQELLNIFR